MTTFSKVKLSGAATSNIPKSIGGLTDYVIHTTPASTTTLDEVWLWGVNTDSESRRIQVSAYDDGGDITQFALVSVPANSTVLLIPGIPISYTSNSGTEGTRIWVTDYDGAPFSVSYPLYVYGYVNRIAV